MLNLLITGIEKDDLTFLVGALKQAPYVNQIFTSYEFTELEKIQKEHRIDLLIVGNPEKYLQWMMETKAKDKQVRLMLITSKAWINQYRDILPLVSGIVFDELSSFWSCKLIQKQIIQLVLDNGRNFLHGANQCVKDMIKIESSDGIMLLKTQEIIYIEKAEKQVIYHTVNREYSSTTTLDESEHRFPDCFYRSHRSYLINLNKVRSIASTGGKGFTVCFKGTLKTALLSYRRRQEFMQLWK